MPPTNCAPPTAVILSQSEYALNHTAPEGETRAALESIHTQAARMATLLSQLLLLARADAGRQVLQRESVNLSELVEMVAETEAEQAAAQKITVETDLEADVRVQGDETMLMRLFINLTENAIRYGRPGGQVRLTLRREKDQAVAAVTDDGIGIAPEHLDKIWQRSGRRTPPAVTAVPDWGWPWCGGSPKLTAAMCRWKVRPVRAVPLLFRSPANKRRNLNVPLIWRRYTVTTIQPTATL